MDTNALDHEERANDAGLRGRNPSHNQAELSAQTWNDHLAGDVDGSTFGLEMKVRARLPGSEYVQRR